MASKERKKYQREWVAKRRQEYLKEKVCINCGIADELHFHHVIPSEKTDNKIFSWKRERIEKELKKCVTLCVDCHRKVHRIINRLKAKHGTSTMYKKYKCRCVECRKEKSTYEKTRIQRLKSKQKEESKARA